MLDQLRRDIQTRLDQLLSEADRLRHALSALSPRDGSKTTVASDGGQAPPAGRRTRSTPAARTSTRRQTSTPQSSERVTQPAGSEGALAGADDAPSAPVRTAPGATKTAVLAALETGDAMTAGEVASATGLGRASVSTTLSKLAKTGEITKASRGYQIARQTSRPAAVADGSEDEQAAT